VYAPTYEMRSNVNSHFIANNITHLSVATRPSELLP